MLATLTRLVHDLGVSVLLAEHRLERVVPFADRMLLLTGDGRVRVGEPAELLATSPVVPPLVELGRAAGWSPLPLSVRDARRRAVGLTDGLQPPSDPPPPEAVAGVAVREPHRGARAHRGRPRGVARPAPGPGHGADGPQRLRQVVAAVGGPGQRAAPRRVGPGRRRRTRPT